MCRRDSKEAGKRNLHAQSCSGFIHTFYVKEDLYKRVLERGVGFFFLFLVFPFLRSFGRQLGPVLVGLCLVPLLALVPCGAVRVQYGSGCVGAACPWCNP